MTPESSEPFLIEQKCVRFIRDIIANATSLRKSSSKVEVVAHTDQGFGDQIVIRTRELVLSSFSEDLEQIEVDVLEDTCDMLCGIMLRTGSPARLPMMFRFDLARINMYFTKTPS
jgi:hypothetical protein